MFIHALLVAVILCPYSPLLLSPLPQEQPAQSAQELQPKELDAHWYAQQELPLALSFAPSVNPERLQKRPAAVSPSMPRMSESLPRPLSKFWKRAGSKSSVSSMISRKKRVTTAFPPQRSAPLSASWKMPRRPLPPPKLRKRPKH
jgi:hypothetical protein